MEEENKSEEKKGFEIKCNCCGCNRVSISQHRDFDDVDPDSYITCNGCSNEERR